MPFLQKFENFTSSSVLDIDFIDIKRLGGELFNLRRKMIRNFIENKMI
jgi:hypothetical protein